MAEGPRNGVSRAVIGLLVFLLVVSIGEGLALFSEYQNNSYLQSYVSNNSTLVLAEIGILVIVGLVLSLLVMRVSRAPSTSRLGRSKRPMVSAAPFFIGLGAMALWFTVVSKVVGGSILYLEGYVVSVLILISGWLMLGDRITSKMAIRNFTRRKASMAIVIMGLMIGTAMISGALVTGDTLTELFTRGAYYGYGYADEVSYTLNPFTGGYQYYSLNVSRALDSSLHSDPTSSKYLSGVTPEIITSVSLNDTRTGFVQSNVALIGTFGNASSALGDFHRSDGSVISSNLANDETVLNDRTARDLNATVGDTIIVFLLPNVLQLKVVGIAVQDARGYFTSGDDIWVSMSAAQTLTGNPGMANYIAITNVGGLRGSIQYTEQVGLVANRTLNGLFQGSQSECKISDGSTNASPSSLCAYGEKKRAVDNATTSAHTLQNFFVVLSTFAIIAGVVLIINIFVMLAEERKSEMGMARAVGMRRGQLMKLFVFEGSLYAAGAAFIGVFAGIAIAYAILYAFGTIIAGVFPVNLSQVLASFTFTPESLFTAFTEGLLITYSTILLASWRVSKLNIIRAIRQIPEPPTRARVYTYLLIFGLGLAIAGFFVFRDSFIAKSAVEALVGPSLVIFGGGLVLSRFLRNRVAFTFTGAALLVQWAIPQFSWQNPIVKTYDFGPELYFAGGVLMVLGGVLVVMYNTDVTVKILRVFYQGRRTLTPIFRTALAYPENKRFRTAATVAMFALVIFTVSAIGSIAAEQNAALNKLVVQDSGGYDIITRTTTPIANLTSRISADPNLRTTVGSVVPFNSTLLSIYDLSLSRDFTARNHVTVGADPDAPAQNNFFLSNTFEMVNMTSDYRSAAEVWSAVRSNSSLVVWSFAEVSTQGPPTAAVTPSVGDVLRLENPFNGTIKNVVVIGILNGVFLDGVISNNHLLTDTFGVESGNLAFIKVAPGQDPVIVSNLLRRSFVELGMSTIVIPIVLKDFLQIGQSFLALFEGFLGLGLVVGIAGLGILSVRSVVERRQEIGVLRALGFKRRMVIAAFIIENSYVALLGILIGVTLGVNLGYAFAVSPNSGLTFVFPWESILGIVGLGYGLSLLVTLNSSRRAGSIPPAEALRYFE